MKLVLTDIGTGHEVVVDSEHIVLFEPVLEVVDGVSQPNGQTHLVFGNGMGRRVSESPADIGSLIGVVAVPQSKQQMAAQIAKGKRKA